MSPYTCPAGHTSADADYCDTCGAPIGSPDEGGAPDAPVVSVASHAAGGGSAGPDPGSGQTTTAETQVCPNCGGDSAPGALFCEDCGYDFTTGAMPPPPTPAPASSLDIPFAPAAEAAPDQPAPDEQAPDQPAAAEANGAGEAAPDGTAGEPAAPAAPDGAPDEAADGAAPPEAEAEAAPEGAAAPVGAAAPNGAVAPAAGTAPDAAPAPEWVAELWVDPDWYRDQGADDPCPSPGPPVVLPLRDRSLLIGRQSVSRNIHPQIDCLTDFGVSRRHAQLTTDGQRWWVEDLRSANGTFVGAAGGPLPSSSIAPGQRHELAEDERLYLGAWTRIVIRRATADEQRPATAAS